MKKILCCLALLFALTGCKDAVSGVTNGDEALITVGKTEITKNDVYTGLKTENGVSSIISKITAYVVEKEVPVTDEIKKEANEYLAEVKKSISDENWKAFLQTMGYKNDQQYIDERVILSVQANELTTTYINENYDQLKEEFQIRKVQIFQTADSKVATEVQEKVKKGELTIPEAVKAYKDKVVTTTFTGNDQVITNATSLDSSIIENIMKVTEDDTLLDVYQFSADLKKFYVVNVVSIDVTFDEARETLLGISNVADKGFAHYLEKYEFTIYDIDLFNGINAQAPTYIVQK